MEGSETHTAARGFQRISGSLRALPGLGCTLLAFFRPVQTPSVFRQVIIFLPRLSPLFIFLPRQSEKPLLHLRGRRFRERNDKNAGGVNARLQQSLDSVCNYCCLSGPRTR